jgi:ankyrin repeat protein
MLGFYSPTGKVEELRKAIAARDLDKAEKFIAKGANVNTRSTEGGLFPLTQAVQLASKELVDLLLKSGANANAEEADGSTALHFAAQATESHILSELIRSGANIEAKDFMACTPLSCAIDCGNDKAAVALLQAGADPSIGKSRMGDSLLIAAIRNGCSDATLTILQSLRSYTDGAVGPAFLAAVAHGRIETVEMLIEKGFPVNALVSGVSPLRSMLDVQKLTLDHSAIAEALLRNGADPLEMDKHGASILLCAILLAKKDLAAILLGYVKESKNTSSEADPESHLAYCFSEPEQVFNLHDSGAIVTAGRLHANSFLLRLSKALSTGLQGNWFDSVNSMVNECFRGAWFMVPATSYEQAGISQEHLKNFRLVLQQIREMEETWPGFFDLLATLHARRPETHDIGGVFSVTQLCFDAMANILEKLDPGAVTRLTGRAKLQYLFPDRLSWLKTYNESDILPYANWFYSFPVVFHSMMVWGISKGEEAKISCSIYEGEAFSSKNLASVQLFANGRIEVQENKS